MKLAFALSRIAQLEESNRLLLQREASKHDLANAERLRGDSAEHRATELALKVEQQRLELQDARARIERLSTTLGALADVLAYAVRPQVDRHMPTYGETNLYSVNGKKS